MACCLCHCPRACCVYDMCYACDVCCACVPVMCVVPVMCDVRGACGVWCGVLPPGLPAGVAGFSRALRCVCCRLRPAKVRIMLFVRFFFGCAHVVAVTLYSYLSSSELRLRSTPRYRLVCNWFPAPRQRFARRDLAWGYPVSRSRVDAYCYYKYTIMSCYY